MTHERLDFRDPAWVAERLGIDVDVIQQYLDQGRLPGVRLGDRWLISESSLSAQLGREAEGQTWFRRVMAVETGADPAVRAIPDMPFTDRARRCFLLALRESVARQHGYIGQEHLLLALVADPECTAARILAKLRVDGRAAVEETLPEGDYPPAAERGLTPRGIKAVEHAYREAQERGDAHVGTEHLLLGMAHVGFELLLESGIGASEIEGALAEIAQGDQPEPPALN